MYVVCLHIPTLKRPVEIAGEMQGFATVNRLKASGRGLEPVPIAPEELCGQKHDHILHCEELSRHQHVVYIVIEGIEGVRFEVEGCAG
jgi:hypothetical protein